MSSMQQALLKGQPWNEYAYFDAFGYLGGGGPGGTSPTYLNNYYGSGWNPTARMNIGKSAGKWYWEYRLGGVSNVCFLGIVKSTYSLYSYPYYTDSVAWMSTSNMAWANGTSITYGTAISSANTVIGFALNMDAGTLELFKNNVSMGIIASGLSGTWHGYATVASTYGETCDLTLITGQTTTYSPPSGFNLLYTENP